MKSSNIAILIISIAGLLFSGYLSLSKLTSGTCSLTEGCTYLFGLPTCVYGFVFFLTLTILSLFLIKGKNTLTAINYVSLAGGLFSGYFTVIDIIQWTGVYTLLLPSCIYGLIMYIIIFVLSLQK
jgi:hypothetical protein